MDQINDFQLDSYYKKLDQKAKNQSQTQEIQRKDSIYLEKLRISEELQSLAKSQIIDNKPMKKKKSVSIEKIHDDYTQQYDKIKDRM